MNYNKHQHYVLLQNAVVPLLNKGAGNLLNLNVHVRRGFSRY